MENEPVQASEPDECPTPGPRSILPSLSVLEEELRTKRPGATYYVALGLAVSLLATAVLGAVIVWS